METDRTLSVRRSTFAQVKRGTVSQQYDLLEELGAGSFGVVCRARSRVNDSFVAIKTINKHKIKDPQKVKDEFNTIRQLDHPNICKAYEFYEDRKNIYLVMELLTGGTLMATLSRQTKFTEVDAAAIMRQILSALTYLHEASFIFRDLKSENVVFFGTPVETDEVARREVKLIDFGLCCIIEKGAKMCRAAGTPYTVAPELVTSPVQYDQKCDAWSAGVVMHMMLCGKYPFNGKTKEELLNRIKKDPCTFDNPIWKKVSKDAKTLVAELLRKRADQRLAVGEALRHPWLARRLTDTPDENFMAEVIDSFKHFQSLNMFEKAAVTVLAWRASDEETRQLREKFVLLDRDGNGHITVQELRVAMQQTGVTIPDDLNALCFEADTDGGGTIEYTEFLAAMLDKQTVIREDVVWEAFRVFDQDGSGTITRRELLKILQGSRGDKIRQMHGHQAVDNFLSEYDASGDDVIDFEEFMDMLNNVKETFTETVSLPSERRRSGQPPSRTATPPSVTPRHRVPRSRTVTKENSTLGYSTMAGHKSAFPSGDIAREPQSFWSVCSSFCSCYTMEKDTPEKLVNVSARLTGRQGDPGGFSTRLTARGGSSVTPTSRVAPKLGIPLSSVAPRLTRSGRKEGDKSSPGASPSRKVMTDEPKRTARASKSPPAPGTPTTQRRSKSGFGDSTPLASPHRIERIGLRGPAPVSQTTVSHAAAQQSVPASFGR